MFNLRKHLSCDKCPEETTTPIHDGIVHDFEHVPETIEGNSSS